MGEALYRQGWAGGAVPVVGPAPVEGWARGRDWVRSGERCHCGLTAAGVLSSITVCG